MRDFICTASGTPQIATEKSFESGVAQPIEELDQLGLPGGAQIWVAMSTKCSRQRCGRMTDKNERFHRHAPQTYTAVAAIWMTAPKQSPVMPPILRWK